MRDMGGGVESHWKKYILRSGNKCLIQKKHDWKVKDNALLEQKNETVDEFHLIESRTVRKECIGKLFLSFVYLLMNVEVQILFLEKEIF